MLEALLSGKLFGPKTQVLDQDNPRLSNGERLWSRISRNPDGRLKRPDRNILRALWVKPQLLRIHGFRETFESLVRSDLTVFNKFSRIWRAVDSCITLGLDVCSNRTLYFKTRWWIRIANSVMRHNSYHYACKEWKDFQKYLYLHFGGSVQPIPIWDKSWPLLPTGSWLVKSPDDLSDREVGRWSWIISGRGLPHGDTVTGEIALQKHEDALCFQKRSEETDLIELQLYSEIAAEQVKGFVPRDFWGKTSGHQSVGNSACLESTRAAGGKRTFVLKALTAWLNEIPQSDRDITLPTGENLAERLGIPRRVTVHPPGMDNLSIERADVKESTGLLTESFPQQEAERTSFQLFAWSFVNLVDGGYLKPDGFPTGKPMPVERTTIGEPGLKTRVVTKSMAAMITYGQAAAHFMNELLWHDPRLRAGLRAGYQGFEWLKQFESGQVTPKYIMVGDFESSTDYIKHENGLIIMNALFDKLRIESPYVRGYFHLLLSPRTFSNPDGLTFTTNAGSLMGEPGTKTLLTFTALVANVRARPGENLFATAGDDQIDGDDDPQELLLYAEATRITSMVPSTDKWAIMTRAVNYCQDVILANRPKEQAKLDLPKLRLCSIEQKQNYGDDDTNPSFGKAREIRTISRWISDEFNGLLIEFVSQFIRNMIQYIELKPELFLAPEWGGLGLPLVPLKFIWDYLPNWKRSLILEREDGLPSADRVLRGWGRAKILERGGEGEDCRGTTEAVLAYTELLEFVPKVTTDDLRKQFPLGTTFPEVRSIAARQGILDEQTLVDEIIKSQQYQDYWNPSIPVSRGFKSRSWASRDKTMKRLFDSSFELRSDLSCPINNLPNWKPALFVNTRELYLYTDSMGMTSSLPLLGKTDNGARVFTHQKNWRLGRVGGITPHDFGQDQLAHVRMSSPIRKKRRITVSNQKFDDK
jgi:hypothetical protein